MLKNDNERMYDTCVLCHCWEEEWLRLSRIQEKNVRGTIAYRILTSQILHAYDAWGDYKRKLTELMGKIQK